MMKCEIIRDLIPLYLDNVCSEDSRKLVEDHLSECSECRKYMKELETELEMVKEKKEVDLDEKRLLQEGAERMKEIGRHVPMMEQDMFLHPYIEYLRELIHSGHLIRIVESITGTLN